MNESERAVMESARFAAMESYFEARPQIAITRKLECIFEAGFDAAYAEVRRLREDAASTAGKIIKMTIEHDWALGEAKRLREENERMRKDAERYQWLALNVKEQLTQESLREESTEHKTMYVLPKLVAWADFCGSISFSEAVDYAIGAARGEK